MKTMLRAAALAALILCSLPAFARKSNNEYRVMTCNIRITGLEEDNPYPERVWENRRDYCVSTILSRKPDFFCLQEVIYDSNEYFKQKCKGYASYGFAGPEMDPFTEGYHFIGKNVIFWRTDRFEFVSAGVYWLSDTPLIGGSMSWGTTRARHCNWVRLRDKKTGTELRVLDVHLDHKSDPARREQIKMVMDECAQYSPELPQVMCGDFNAGIKSEPIKYIRTCEGWAEMYEAIHGPEEPGFTAHGFKGPERVGKSNRRIDFIWYRGTIEVKDCQIIKDSKPFNGATMFPSDHYFVVADFTINK